MLCGGENGDVQGSTKNLLDQGSPQRVGFGGADDVQAVQGVLDLLLAQWESEYGGGVYRYSRQHACCRAGSLITNSEIRVALRFASRAQTAGGTADGACDAFGAMQSACLRGALRLQVQRWQWTSWCFTAGRRVALSTGPTSLNT